MNECPYCEAQNCNGHCRNGDTDRHGETLLHKFCAEFGRPMNEAIEIFAWMDQNAAGNDAVESHEQLRALNSRFRKAVQILVAYQQNQKEPDELRMSTRAMALALGYTTAADAEESAELGRKMGIIKATVNKCVNHFISKLDLPPAPTQRKAAARKNMSAARLKQLKPT